MKYSFSAVMLALLFVQLSACSSKTKDSNIIDPGRTNGIFVKDGQDLVDACDNKIVLRGVNMGSVYGVDLGAKELDEIAKTGANSVRLVLQTTYQNWAEGGAVTALKAAQVEALIKICIRNKMIAVLELHDYTGSANPASAIAGAVNWWMAADMYTMLKKYQSSIIINIANEPDNGAESEQQLYTAYSTAITNMRQQGFTCPLMLDVYNWAKDPQFVVDKGAALISGDPLHNIIFSIHAYWPTHGAYGDYSDARITAYMNSLKNTGLPIVIGELALADVQDQNYGINYPLIMKLCQSSGFGYLCWWWGFYDNPGANNVLSMTTTGLYTGLGGAGKVMAETDPNSIKKTSVKPCSL